MQTFWPDIFIRNIFDHCAEKVEVLPIFLV